MISIKDYVEEQKKSIKEKTHSRKPSLAIIQVGKDEASNSYIKGKKKDCEEVGFNYVHVNLSEDTTEYNVASTIRSVQKNCDGIIIQLPLPCWFSKDKLFSMIDPKKDVDGFLPNSEFEPCTPKGIIDWLEYNSVQLSGTDVCVIGRSDIVGKPLVRMLIERGATVTCCNSKTQDIKKFTQSADIVIVAVGSPKKFDASYFCTFKDQIVIDVGINKFDGKLCGDVDSRNMPNNVYVTPVPGGVGLLTRLALLRNVEKAYKETFSYVDSL